MNDLIKYLKKNSIKSKHQIKIQTEGSNRSSILPLTFVTNLNKLNLGESF